VAALGGSDTAAAAAGNTTATTTQPSSKTKKSNLKIVPKIPIQGFLSLSPSNKKSEPIADGGSTSKDGEERQPAAAVIGDDEMEAILKDSVFAVNGDEYPQRVSKLQPQPVELDSGLQNDDDEDDDDEEEEAHPTNHQHHKSATTPDEQYLDLVQITSLLLLPTLAREAQEFRNGGPRPPPERQSCEAGQGRQLERSKS